MKRFFYIVITVLLFSACVSEGKYDALKEKTDYLKREYAILKSNVRNAEISIDNLKNQRTALENDIKELKTIKGMIHSGKEPKYMVCFNIRQSTFTLDMGEMVKNGMNAMDIWIETSESFYNSVKVGQTIDSKFKGGSFLIDGDVSHLNITVKNKKVQ